MSVSADIPDDPKNINYRLYILDPLSVIVKLAILRNKPVGTKLRITDNVFYIKNRGHSRHYVASISTRAKRTYNIYTIPFNSRAPLF